MSAERAGPRTIAIVFWCYTALLIVATHIPNKALPKVEIPWFDKFEHVGAYGLWTLLLLASGLLHGSFRSRAIKALFWSLVIAIADELLQMIPVLNRVADPVDVIADLIGSVCAVCAAWAWQRWHKSSR